MGIKATFVIDEKVLTQAKQIVKEGLAKSMSNLIEIALKDEIKRLKMDQIHREIIEASKDPLFLADIQEITSDFKHVDFEDGTK